MEWLVWMLVEIGVFWSIVSAVGLPVAIVAAWRSMKREREKGNIARQKSCDGSQEKTEAKWFAIKSKFL